MSSQVGSDRAIGPEQTSGATPLPASLHAMADGTDIAVSFDQAMRRLFREVPGTVAVWECGACPVTILARATVDLPLCEVAVEHIDTAERGEDREVVIQPILGLTGVSGILPMSFTRALNDPETDDPGAGRAFLGLIDGRFAQLFYGAYAKSQAAFQAERGETDGVPQYLLDIAGLGTPGLKARLARFGCVDADVARFFANFVGAASRSAYALTRMLESVLGLPVVVNPYRGRWYPIPRALRARLQGHARRSGGNLGLGSSGRTEGKPVERTGSGRPGVVADRAGVSAPGLGAGVVLGSRYYDYQQTFQVLIGPLDFDAYVRWVTRDLDDLIALIRLHQGYIPAVELRFRVRGETIPPLTLGDPSRASLGVSGWIRSTPLQGVVEDATVVL